MPKKLIYVEDAIEAVHNLYAIFGSEGEWVDRKDVFEAINSLPFAQPEIIRCKDCKYMQEDKIFHQCWCNGREVKYDHFCGYAERRTDA